MSIPWVSTFPAVTGVGPLVGLGAGFRIDARFRVIELRTAAALACWDIGIDVASQQSML